MHAEEEIDDSAQDGGVLGGRSDWGTDPRLSVEGGVLGGRSDWGTRDLRWR